MSATKVIISKFKGCCRFSCFQTLLGKVGMFEGWKVRLVTMMMGVMMKRRKAVFTLCKIFFPSQL